MVLATDLDGTFLGGSHLQKQQLYRLIKENAGVRLIFVTGRGLESVMPLLRDPFIPDPDYIICDVGATIVDGHTLEPLGTLQSDIEDKWPGGERMAEQLNHIDGLLYQAVPQQRRCSYFTKSAFAINEAEQAADDLDCDVIYSADKFLDVLPRGVNKGSTLTSLIKYLGVDAKKLLVAGDTLNDLAMYQCGFKSVVVGNAEDKLVDATSELKDVFYAAAPGAGGILEAIVHFSFFTHRLEQPAGDRTTATLYTTLNRDEQTSQQKQ